MHTPAQDVPRSLPPPPEALDWTRGGPAPAGSVFWPTGLPGAGLAALVAVGCFGLSAGAGAGVVGEMMAGGQDPERLLFGPPAAIILFGFGVAAVRAVRRARDARRALEDGRWRRGVLVLEDGLMLHLDGHPEWLSRSAVRGRRLRSDLGGGAGVPHPELIVEGPGGRPRAIALPSSALAAALADWAGGAPMGRPPS